MTYYSLAEPPHGSFDHAVVLAQHGDRWIHVRRADRETWECPGGCVEPEESLLDCAARELQEETGARRFALVPVAPFARGGGEHVQLGMLFYARVYERAAPPHDTEIGEVRVSHEAPEPQTWPEAAAAHARRVAEFLGACWWLTPQAPS